MEGRAWVEICEDRGRWRHRVGRQLTGSGYVKDSTEIQRKHGFINIHKHINLLN
jgi:hypothetical protein